MPGRGGARDKNPAALQKALRVYPALRTTTDECELLTSPDIDAVAIVTPVWTHYPLAKLALENGKHVFVEKPFTSTVAQAEELVELAERKNLRIMVDHTFLFTGAVKKIRELIDKGVLGPLYYFDSSRVNLGLFQHDVSVVWDLAPHDLSIMDYVIQDKAEAVVATGGSHVNQFADMAFLTIYFPNKVIAHINVNWLSPVKVRTTLIGARDKMLVWNDLEADEKIKVYDKGVNVTSKEGVYDLLVSYRTGDVWAPKVDQTEALKAELALLREVRRERRDAVQRRPRRPARRPDARSRRPVPRRARQSHRAVAVGSPALLASLRRAVRQILQFAVRDRPPHVPVPCIPSSSTSAAPSSSRCWQRADPLPAEPGYFRFGDAVAYGRQSAGAPSPVANGDLVDVARAVLVVERTGAPAVRPRGGARQPALRTVPRGPQRRSSASPPPASLTPLYYFLRPALPVGVQEAPSEARVERLASASRFPGGPLTSRSKR